MQNNNNTEIHIAVAERLIGYVMNNPGAVASLRSRLPDGRLFPRQDNLSRVWDALLALSADGCVISPEALANAAEASVSRLTGLLVSEARTELAETETLVPVLLERGKQAATQRIGNALIGGQVDRQAAIKKLEEVDMYGLSQADMTAADLVDQFEEEQLAPPAKANPTGIAALDVALWEMPVGESTIMAAVYKGQKSRTARNMILAAACRGAKVFVVLAEGWVEEFTRECLSMIANGYLLHVGRFNDPQNSKKITGKYLSRQRTHTANTLQGEALSAAKRVFRSLDILVWDARHGAKNQASITGKARGLVADGYTLLALDYVQNVDWPGDGIYEQMTHARRWLSDIRAIGREQGGGMHILLVSQKNEESIRAGGRNAGILGGGNLAYEVDNMLAPHYDEEQSPGVLFLPLKFSRSNPAFKMQFEQEICSGLFTRYIGTTPDGGVYEAPVHVVPPELFGTSGGKQFVLGMDDRDDLIFDAP